MVSKFGNGSRVECEDFLNHGALFLSHEVNLDEACENQERHKHREQHLVGAESACTYIIRGCH